MMSDITKVIVSFVYLGKSKSLVFSHFSKIIFVSLIKDRGLIILTIMALSKMVYPGQLLGHQF